MQDEPHGWDGEYDYIVVGSGAGGGPVAANLARAGYCVALLEAGGDCNTYSYEVPAFYTSACEDPAFRWDYIVRHYDDPAQQERDSKAIRSERGVGVWYPRAGTLGGCTAHHALITIRPHDSDWDNIAKLTGDRSWEASAMRRFFAQVERCTYREEADQPPGAHGFHGWLWTTIAPFKLLAKDLKAVRIVLRAVGGAIEGKVWRSLRYLRERWREHRGRSLWGFVLAFLDPNDGEHPSFKREGVFCVPFSARRGKRLSVRELLHETQAAHPQKLTMRMHTLVTRILFAPAEGDACRRAVGVELMEGEHLYGADPNAVAGSAEPRRRLRARREVILCGGAFNSPQLLMLSGIGDPEELKRHGIEIVVDLPGVGQNLQDRYEVGVVCRTHGEFALTRGATFDGPAPGEPPDPLFAQWLEGKGPYATNGGLIALTKRSGLTPEPDLFIFCVPGDFHGYYRGRTDDNAYTKSRFSWVILKSHTTNRDGRVRLRSADPREPPDISFRYFHEGSPGWEGDLAAVAHAVEFVRHLNAKLTCILAEETVPGADVTGDRLRRFIRDEAWGHHASCTNRMGRRCDRYAVVDSEFRVMHTSGLRVVDASVFPEIPGFFITTSIYMIAEKASELILADAARGPPPAEECAEGAQGRVP